MVQIDVSFQVWKELTLRREAEETTMDDVIRKILGIPSNISRKENDSEEGASYKGILFPNGTQFKGTYKGKVYTGEIKNRVWVDPNGKVFSSPSAAAQDFVVGGMNGWWFWSCKRPYDADWISIGKVRDAAKVSPT